MAIPIRVSISHSNPWILLMFRIMVAFKPADFPSIVVTFKFMICFPMVAPRLDSKNEAYRKNRIPLKNGNVPNKDGEPSNIAGSARKGEIIQAIIPVSMLSIIPAISLRSQWS